MIYIRFERFDNFRSTERYTMRIVAFLIALIVAGLISTPLAAAEPSTCEGKDFIGGAGQCESTVSTDGLLPELLMPQGLVPTHMTWFDRNLFCPESDNFGEECAKLYEQQSAWNKYFETTGDNSSLKPPPPGQEYVITGAPADGVPTISLRPIQDNQDGPYWLVAAILVAVISGALVAFIIGQPVKGAGKR